VSADVLRWPVLGRFLRWRRARTSVQLVLLGLAALVVLHGLFGPQLAPANLATVLTWVHYRGLLVVGLLAAGNLFCTGCPFVLVRDAGRRARAPTIGWPRGLRTKWLGVALFAGVLFAYELFDLWSLPRATAWLVLAYFGAALTVDLVFRGASFCKYLCPIGQFNFVASTVSPLELRVRERETCRTCRTADCIKGRREGPSGRLVQRGCELGLFLPAKVGNLDCTFCLDCVQACPHDNVVLATRVPALELTETGRRSGIGRLARRPDLAALVVLFVFGGLLNAFAMVSPVYAVETWLAGALGLAGEVPVLALLFVAALVVAPLALVGGASLATPVLAGAPVRTAGRAFGTFAWALVPLGFGVWLAHYGFHLLTGVLTVIPVTQSAAMDALGWPVLGAPLWGWTGMRPGSVYPLQVGLVLLGASGSIGLAYLCAEQEYGDRPVRVAVPWVALTLAIAAAALWTLSQPMEMRGVAGFGG
jgi:ferredoxin